MGFLKKTRGGEEKRTNKIVLDGTERERGKESKIGSEWEEERGRFFEDRKWKIREIESRRNEGNMFGELVKKDRGK